MGLVAAIALSVPLVGDVTSSNASAGPALLWVAPPSYPNLDARARDRAGQAHVDRAVRYGDARRIGGGSIGDRARDLEHVVRVVCLDELSARVDLGAQRVGPRLESVDDDPLVCKNSGAVVAPVATDAHAHRRSVEWAVGRVEARRGAAPAGSAKLSDMQKPTLREM